MASPALIRLATPADAPALAHLNHLFNKVLLPADLLASRLADPQHVEIALVAELQQKLVGFAGLRLVPTLFYTRPHAELTELFVEEPYRKLGLGRALVQAAEQLAQQRGATFLFILTGFDNEPALALYHQLGYQDEDLALLKYFPKEAASPPTE